MAVDEDVLKRLPNEGPVDWSIVGKLFWIALRLIAVFYIGQTSSPFFYQGF